MQTGRRKDKRNGKNESERSERNHGNRSGGVDADKRTAKTLKLVLGGLDNYLIGHVINGEMDEVEAVSHIMSIYNRIVDMEKGEK